MLDMPTCNGQTTIAKHFISLYQQKGNINECQVPQGPYILSGMAFDHNSLSSLYNSVAHLDKMLEKKPPHTFRNRYRDYKINYCPCSMQLTSKT